MMTFVEREGGVLLGFFERPPRDDLTFNTRAQLMRARQDSIGDASINGKYPENTPNFSGNAGFTYRPAVGGLGLTSAGRPLVDHGLGLKRSGSL